MKKYVLGIFAVIMAIAFSAFTAPRQTKNVDEYLYWYYYDVANDDLAGQIGTTEKTHLEAKNATDCDDDEFSVIDCARGYEMPQSPFDTSPDPGDEQVKKPEPGK